MATEASAAQRIAAAIDRAEQAAEATAAVYFWGQPGVIDTDDLHSDIRAYIWGHCTPAQMKLRCAADRRVLERHRQYTIRAGYDGAGMSNCNRCNGYEWPCDEIRDLAARWGVEIGDQT